MATPILNSVSKDLAYKLQDPVSAGTSNGVRLSADERLRYILRAYRRLLRTITMLYPVLIQKLFQSYYVSTTGTTDSTGQITTLGFAEVFDVYCKEPSDEVYFKATFVTPDVYYDIETGQNSFYVPDLNTDRYYWTRISNDVLILPAVQLSYKIMYRADVALQVENGDYDGAYDLDVPTEHLDLILSFAAAEAYTDIGQINMVQAYQSDVNAQLSLLASLYQKKEKNDDKESA